MRMDDVNFTVRVVKRADTSQKRSHQSPFLRFSGGALLPFSFIWFHETPPTSSHSPKPPPLRGLAAVKTARGLGQGWPPLPMAAIFDGGSRAWPLPELFLLPCCNYIWRWPHLRLRAYPQRAVWCLGLGLPPDCPIPGWSSGMGLAWPRCPHGKPQAPSCQGTCWPLWPPDSLYSGYISYAFPNI